MEGPGKAGYNTDPNIKALKKKGFIIQGSTLPLTSCRGLPLGRVECCLETPLYYIGRPVKATYTGGMKGQNTTPTLCPP